MHWLAVFCAIQFVVLQDKFIVAEVPQKYSTDVIIRKEGYPSESHYVTTEDGYILNIHRIPTGKNGQNNGKVVLLQHGFEDSSTGWILLGPEKALGYILADQGYDVWLGNSRGNYYSRNHTTLNPDEDSSFWQFSFHEMGLYDLPKTIDYILNKTGETGLYYAGHSQGTSIMYVMCSLKPEYNKKIKMYVHLSPVAFLDHMYSPLLKMVAKGLTIPFFSSLVGKDEFMPKQTLLSRLIPNLCNGILTSMCENVMFAFVGLNPEEMNATLIPLMLVHLPAGASTRQIVHFGQEIESGHFRQFDYGVYENLNKYKQFSPPDYELEKVTAPGYLIYSTNDWISSPLDVDRLYSKLKNVLGKILVPKESFSHPDFVYGISAADLVYNNVMRIFGGQKIES